MGRVTTPHDGRQWWRGAVGYEVYIRSFADSSGDGVGDLQGLTSKLDHIASLGADIVWITPFYPSPMVDFGYDVADYLGVDPLFGTVTDLEKLTVEAHSRGLRVVIDIVPNHCSSSHRWFQQALADPNGPYRDYFIWGDPAPDGGPPNNWIGYFGGPAWTLEPSSGQYYLHLFLPEQPDLNWRNPAVLDEFDDILRGWLDRGIDGFRIDVAQALIKDEALRSNPVVAPWDPEASRWEQWDAFDHVHDVGQPEALDIFARWRRVVEPYDAVLIGETYVLEPAELGRLLRGDGLDVGFWFKPMHIDWDAAEIRAAIAAPMAGVDDAGMIGWVAASHDEVRPPTRFGGGDVGRRRSLAFTTLLFGLPGLPFLYQGEELGLLEGIVPPERKSDPVGSDVTLSRDGCRTPMPWEPGVAFGFSTTEDTWLPDGGRSDADTASVQAADDSSWFARYSALVDVRHRLINDRPADVEWVDLGADVVAYRRGDLLVAANVGSSPVDLELRGRVEFATDGGVGPIEGSTTLAADHAIVVVVDSA